MMITELPYMGAITGAVDARRAMIKLLTQVKQYRVNTGNEHPSAPKVKDFLEQCLELLTSFETIEKMSDKPPVEPTEPEGEVEKASFLDLLPDGALDNVTSDEGDDQLETTPTPKYTEEELRAEGVTNKMLYDKAIADGLEVKETDKKDVLVAALLTVMV